MKLKQLDAFLAVAEHRTIRGAARALGVTQPAISSIVRELEQELGVPLVVRSVKGIELTDYGSAFAIRARLIVEEIQRTRDEIEQLRLGTTGSVSIAVSPTVALTILPRAFAAFMRDLPGATLNVDDALTATDLARLRDGSLDFIVTHQLSNAKPDPDAFASIPLFRTAFAVVARNRHRLARAARCASSSMRTGACRATAKAGTIWCARSSRRSASTCRSGWFTARRLPRRSGSCRRRMRSACSRGRSRTSNASRAESSRWISPSRCPR